MTSHPTDPFQELVRIMHRLRAPGGCPWDAEQTHESLKPYLLEEAYEVIEAIEDGDDRDVCEELGDLLLQVVFHAELAEERKAFTIDDVVGAISEKLVRRHPHVFGDVSVGSSAEVAANWSRIKAAEKAARGAPDGPESVLAGVPSGLPALIRAHRIGEKASGVGFDWPSAAGAREKIGEELAEVDEAASSGDSAALADEIGDLLFAVASYARRSGFNAENLLRNSVARFSRRFRHMEDEFAAAERDMHDASPADLDASWERAKRSRQ